MEQSDGDLADAYRPPSIEADAGRARPNGSAPGSVPPFFVVEPSKLVVMCVGTMGFYQIYWFYRHWRQYRTWSGERLSPGLRAALTLFFTHRLFAAINAADTRSRVSQERSGSDQTDRAPWSHSASATLFVVLSLLGGGLQRATAKLAPASIFEFLGSLLPLVAIFPLLKAQEVANRASGDPKGASNASVTGANIAWLLAGLVLWVLTFFGTLLGEG